MDISKCGPRYERQLKFAMISGGIFFKIAI